jgi:hypothetical protein
VTADGLRAGKFLPTPQVAHSESGPAGAWCLWRPKMASRDTIGHLQNPLFSRFSTR